MAGTGIVTDNSGINTGNTDTAFLKNPFRKQLESPANIPTGSGLIDKSLNQMQKTQKQKYDAMRETGTWSEKKYQQEMKRLLGDKKLSSNTVTIDGKTFERRRGSGYGGGMEVTGDSTTRETRPTQYSNMNYRMSQNPDRTIMTRAEIRDAFRPSNIISPSKNYVGGRFGTLDEGNAPLAVQNREDRERVRSDFYTPSKISTLSPQERRAAADEQRRKEAKERADQFKETGFQTFGGKRQPQKSADDTFGTNMPSNPAFGFRSQMDSDSQKAYDRSAAISSDRARVDPSLGNVLTSTGNLIKRGINDALGIEGGTFLTREKSLQTVGEAQLDRANQFMNRPMYQRDAYARREEGITPSMLKAKNEQRIRDQARADYNRFQAEKRQKAVDKAAAKYGQNTGSGRKGGFGAGTVGKGMSSNPAGMRQTGVGKSAGNLSRHSTGHSSKKSGGKKGSGSSGSSGSSSSSSGSSSSSSSSSSGGYGGGVGNKTNRRGSGVRRRCDIRCKYDIMPLTNMNLINDDLAEVAYFVKELQS